MAIRTKMKIIIDKNVEHYVVIDRVYVQVHGVVLGVATSTMFVSGS